MVYETNMDRYDIQQMPFDRLPPKVLDDQVFVDFANYFSRIQEFSGLANATNSYDILTRNYVAGMSWARPTVFVGTINSTIFVFMLQLFQTLE